MMRSSRLIISGTVIAAAVASGTAMTAANVVPSSVAGYGEGMVSGATATNIAYTPLVTDNTKLASVEFTLSTNVTGKTSTMTLKSGASAGPPVVEGTPTRATPYSCVAGQAWDAVTERMSVFCATGDNPRFDAFSSVGLTVVQ
jgi:hypothetical protein